MIPEEKWTEGMKNIAGYAGFLGEELMGVTLVVSVVRTTNNFAACYGVGQAGLQPAPPRSQVVRAGRDRGRGPPADPRVRSSVFRRSPERASTTMPFVASAHGSSGWRWKSRKRFGSSCGSYARRIERGRLRAGREIDGETYDNFPEAEAKETPYRRRQFIPYFEE